jgi:hypothetical protein
MFAIQRAAVPTQKGLDGFGLLLGPKSTSANDEALKQ